MSTEEFDFDTAKTGSGFTLPQVIAELQKPPPASAYKPVPGASDLTDIDPAYLTEELLGDLIYCELRGTESKPEYKVLNACLAWRWAHTRSDEREMFKRLNMLKDEAAREQWSKIRPLVEAAWCAPNTGEVIRLTRDILASLNIPESVPPHRFKGVSVNGVPLQRAAGDPVSAVPSGPAIDGLGLDGPPRETREHHAGDGRSWTKPQPYIALEDAARALARHIVETLQEPRPNVRPRADATSGRYAYRLEARDWERPFQRRAELGRAPRSLALCVLVDWSSSMRGSAEGVKLALIALHLATEQLQIPHAITFFGAGRDAVPHERIETIVSFNDQAEWPKALIAGYEPSAGNEYLLAALERAISVAGSFRAAEDHLMGARRFAGVVGP